MKEKLELNSLALKTRRMMNEDEYSPIDLFSLVNLWREKNFTIVHYPMSDNISGMCTRVDNETIICINSKSSYGRQRFTLAHELYHCLYEESLNRIVCGMSFVEKKSDSEKEADAFASYLLIPYDALIKYSENISTWTLEDIINAEQYFQISHMAMLTRLRSEGMITKKEYQDNSIQHVALEASKMGYGKELYLQFPKEYYTTGEYIRKVEEMREKNLISNGKREELLLDAFRPDIVFNLEEEGVTTDD